MPAVAPGFEKPTSLATRKPFSTIISLFYRARIACLPYYLGLVYFLVPPLRNHPNWTIKQCVTVTRTHLTYAWLPWIRFNAPATLDATKLGQRLAHIPPAPQALLKGPMARDPFIKPTALQGVWYPSAYDPKADADKRVILEFHVGGYTTGPPDETYYEPGTKTVCEITKSKALIVFYRRCCLPGQHFPSQLQDVLSAFHHAIYDLKIDPARIVLSGDSAGGHLVLTFLRYLADFGAEIPRPGAALVISPMLDMHEPTQKQLVESGNYNTDMVRKEHIDWSIETFVPADIPTDDKWVSPGRAPFALPIPTYIEAGMLECLGPSIVEFAVKCKALTDKGTAVEINGIESSTHATLWLGGNFGFDKEQKEAAEKVNEFLTKAGL